VFDFQEWHLWYLTINYGSCGRCLHDLWLKPTGSLEFFRASGRAKLKASLEETSTGRSGRPGLSMMVKLGHQPNPCVFSMHAACETAQGTWQRKNLPGSILLCLHLPLTMPFACHVRTWRFVSSRQPISLCAVWGAPTLNCKRLATNGNELQHATTGPRLLFSRAKNKQNGSQ
jgi:hypothetical protein